MRPQKKRFNVTFTGQDRRYVALVDTENMKE